MPFQLAARVSKSAQQYLRGTEPTEKSGHVHERRTLPKFAASLAICLALFPATAEGMPFLPDFDAATFLPGTAIDNTYFPILGKKTRFFEGEKEEDGETIVERFELTPFGKGPTILGVETTILLDRAYEDGMIVEETFDFYAQDIIGNVWYFGEDVTNFVYDDDGNLIGTNSASSWRAGVNGAFPGFIMPADLTIGFNYYQEFAAADEALDQATTISLGGIIDLDIGAFENVLQVFETSELSPDAREFKYYAPGLGLVLVEEGLDTNLENPEISVALIDVRKVSEPATLLLFAMGAAGVGLTAQFARRNRRPIGTC
ncbi:PEP-CTERM sorting domain-containing protein [Pelagibius sp. Alg239-R121]|uniref:PEP-CTERM sorting domain-containing protein n=1 Tax=Pelagibius sp. Alg239-R121 TaxID=2993448 RepID=UPI0024A62EA7|nr:PEP-CTERM sorting domain-containing protein [Pelagibius sp. Alg239-R121]